MSERALLLVSAGVHLERQGKLLVRAIVEAVLRTFDEYLGWRVRAGRASTRETFTP